MLIAFFFIKCYNIYIFYVLSQQVQKNLLIFWRSCVSLQDISKGGNVSDFLYWLADFFRKCALQLEALLDPPSMVLLDYKINGRSIIIKFDNAHHRAKGFQQISSYLLSWAVNNDADFFYKKGRYTITFSSEEAAHKQMIRLLAEVYRVLKLSN